MLRSELPRTYPCLPQCMGCWFQLSCGRTGLFRQSRQQSPGTSGGSGDSSASARNSCIHLVEADYEMVEAGADGIFYAALGSENNICSGILRNM